MKTFLTFSALDNSNVCIEDHLLHKKYQASSKHISDLILNGESSPYYKKVKEYGLFDQNIEESSVEIVENAKHWIKRGWHLSLFYYLKTRSITFADRFQNGPDVRKELIKKYLEEDGAPPTIEIQGTKIPLPLSLSPEKDIKKFKKDLLKRKSTRTFKGVSLKLTELSTLLHEGLNNIRMTREESNKGSKNNPLAFYMSHGVSFEYFLIVYDINELENGVYYYDLIRHEIVLIQAGNFREFMVDCLQGMKMPRTANLSIIINCDLHNYRWRYRHERSLRNLYIESGRSCQELINASFSLNLGTLCTPAIKDSKLLNLLGLNNNRFTPMYSITMGKNK